VPDEDKQTLVQKMAAHYRLEPEEFKRVVKKTCMPGNATEEQFLMFLAVANEYDLNPLVKQIYAFPDKSGGITPIISVDGWTKKMLEHPSFNGVRFSDQFTESGQLVAVTCRIYRKGIAHPVEITELLKENRRNTPTWAERPYRMLRHRALCQAIRTAFNLAGVMDIDEYEQWMETTAKEVEGAKSPLTVANSDDIPDEEELPKLEPPKTEEAKPGNGRPRRVKAVVEPKPEPPPPDRPIDTDKQDMLCDLIRASGWSYGQISSVLQKHAGVESAEQVMESKLDAVVESIRQEAEARRKGQ